MKKLITSSNLTFTKKKCNCGIISKDIKLYKKTNLTRKSHKSKSKNNHKSKNIKSRK